MNAMRCKLWKADYIIKQPVGLDMKLSEPNLGYLNEKIKEHLVSWLWVKWHWVKWNWVNCHVAKIALLGIKIS